MFKKIFGNKPEYKFKEPRNTACITCDHVLIDKKPILYVSHDKDDSMWQFLCGENDHKEENAKLIGLKEATEIDNSIKKSLGKNLSS